MAIISCRSRRSNVEAIWVGIGGFIVAVIAYLLGKRRGHDNSGVIDRVSDAVTGASDTVGTVADEVGNVGNSLGDSKHELVESLESVAGSIVTINESRDTVKDVADTVAGGINTADRIREIAEELAKRAKQGTLDGDRSGGK